ncbi:MAG: VOC family protein [Mycobacterium sp.]|nr:VOC family protein [Mycobacterium sp.]
MKIIEVAITTTDLGATAAFYRDLLELPVTALSEGFAVDIGRSRLIVTDGAPFAGVHHLAFGISPVDFDLSHRWLRRRTELFSIAGSDTFDGPAGWDSRSVYFRGPDGIVLELIARQADRNEPGSGGESPHALSISEVGIGVPDVGLAARQLAESFNLSPFPPQLSRFAPVGGHDGLLILANSNRVWFPTDEEVPAQGPVTVRIESAKAAPGGKVALTAGAIIQAD